MFCKSNIFSLFLVNSITLDLPSIKYLIYTLDLSGNADPVSTISEKYANLSEFKSIAAVCPKEVSPTVNVLYF